MKSRYLLPIICVLILVCTHCVTTLPTPKQQRTYSPAEAQKVVERVVNLQTNSVVNVYVNKDYYKTTSVWDGDTRHYVVYFSEVGKMKIKKHPSCYCLIIYDKSGKKMDVVKLKNSTKLQDLVDAIRSLQ